ncbi:ParB/RepB/Spo0J family partition protein [Acinetobacter pollinis]|uniref:ParB/RepB/Spo0J family partition protein n=1 Tax=Acinetobacter pollinis TaxID=2605270 RepID=A0ABU6DUM9_9GAMM|nr:ParB/RepB/Spo0J family partition protein [Acinetobacter pollinis]MEB5477567.1 ParB/RepB/Spo0J family partition protein [Acinetobacter pollinis]
MAKKPLIVDFEDTLEMEQAFIGAAGTGEISINTTTKNNVFDIDTDLIDFSQHQPRIITDTVLQEIETLAISISTNGQIYPIVVIKNADRYELVGGEKRFRAVRDILKNKTICAIVLDNTSTENTALISLVDNLHRSNLSDFELINSIQKHCNEFGYSLQNIDFITNKYQIDQSKYFRLMSFFKLPEYMKNDLRINPKAISGATAQQLQTELNKLFLKFDHQLVESTTHDVWKTYLNEYLNSNRPSKRFIFEIEKQLNKHNIMTKKENCKSTSEINKAALKNKNGHKFGSIKIENNNNGKTVINIRASLNSNFTEAKIEQLEDFLSTLNEHG